MSHILVSTSDKLIKTLTKTGYEIIDGGCTTTMRKKLLLLLVLSLFTIVLPAQTEHMKFAGIPLNGTIDQFQKKLMAKGYRLNAAANRALPVGTRCFIGTFAGKRGNIAVYYDSETKTVYGAKVYYDGLSEDKAESELDNLKSMLSIKYGEDNITDGTDKSGNATFTVNTGLGSIYCYTMKNEALSGYPYHWTTHAVFHDYANDSKHESNVLDDF